jgi:hypothetical protein
VAKTSPKRTFYHESTKIRKHGKILDFHAFPLSHAPRHNLFYRGVFGIVFSFTTRNSTEFAIKEEKLAYYELFCYKLKIGQGRFFQNL